MCTERDERNYGNFEDMEPVDPNTWTKEGLSMRELPADQIELDDPRTWGKEGYSGPVAMGVGVISELSGQ